MHPYNLKKLNIQGVQFCVFNFFKCKIVFFNIILHFGLKHFHDFLDLSKN